MSNMKQNIKDRSYHRLQLSCYSPSQGKASGSCGSFFGFHPVVEPINCPLIVKVARYMTAGNKRFHLARSIAMCSVGTRKMY